MNFDESLEQYKAQFTEWRALVVLDDKALRRYVMCWSPALVQQLSDWPLSHTPTDLWACVRVDFQALADLTGDSLPSVMSYFRQAQGMQLIYPDGSVAVTVAGLLDKKLSQIRGV